MGMKRVFKPQNIHGFIQLTMSNNNKCLINVNNINQVWPNPFGGTFLCTNQEKDIVYLESYEEKLQKLLESL